MNVVNNPIVLFSNNGDFYEHETFWKLPQRIFFVHHVMAKCVLLMFFTLSVTSVSQWRVVESLLSPQSALRGFPWISNFVTS